MNCFDLDMKLWDKMQRAERTYEVLTGYIETKLAKDNAARNRKAPKKSLSTPYVTELGTCRPFAPAAQARRRRTRVGDG